jgi:multisubunit Na+/H+ antiporter MnhB subunit
MERTTLQAAGQDHRGTVAVSWLAVIVLLLLASSIVSQAFQVFGGNFAVAGTGAWVWLGLSAASLLLALFALWDLVYEIGAGAHLVFKPVLDSERFLARHRPPWLRIVLNWATLGAIGLGVYSGYTWFT